MVSVVRRAITFSPRVFTSFAPRPWLEVQWTGKLHGEAVRLAISLAGAAPCNNRLVEADQDYGLHCDGNSIAPVGDLPSSRGGKPTVHFRHGRVWSGISCSARLMSLEAMNPGPPVRSRCRICRADAQPTGGGGAHVKQFTSNVRPSKRHCPLSPPNWPELFEKALCHDVRLGAATAIRERCGLTEPLC